MRVNKNYLQQSINRPLGANGLILRVDRKKTSWRYLQGDLDFECERDWSLGLGAILVEGKKIKNYFSSFRDFSGKSRYCHIVGVRIHNKPTKFDENCWSHF